MLKRLRYYIPPFGSQGEGITKEKKPNAFATKTLLWPSFEDIHASELKKRHDPGAKKGQLQYRSIGGV